MGQKYRRSASQKSRNLDPSDYKLISKIATEYLRSRGSEEHAAALDQFIQLNTAAADTKSSASGKADEHAGHTKEAQGADKTAKGKKADTNKADAKGAKA